MSGRGGWVFEADDGIYSELALQRLLFVVLPPYRLVVPEDSSQLHNEACLKWTRHCIHLVRLILL